LVLKPRQAFLTVLVYLFMGFIGLPVFAGGTAGPGKLFGPTGGFYFGFLFAAAAISMLKGREICFKRYALVTICVGIPIQHLLGILFLCFYNGFHVGSAALTISAPFLPGDVVKCVIAAAVATALNRALGKMRT
jgi:biotin transport system substrate-specific component